MQQSTTFAVAGFVLLIVLIVAFAPRSDAGVERRAHRTAREVGLGLSTEVEPVVIRRLRRADRYALIGSALAWSVTLVVLTAATRSDRYSTTVFWVVSGAVVVGRPLGNAIAALVDSRARSQQDRPRIARSRGVRMDDYVPVSELTAVRLVTIGTLVTLGVSFALRLLPLPATVGLLVLSAVSFAALEVGGRRIVDQHQTAHTTTDLAWDDALRAKNLRALVSAPLATGLYTALAVLFAVSESPGAPVGVMPWVVLLVIAALAVVGVWRLIRTGDRDRYYLRRLWPETAAAGEQAELAARSTS